jgi:hypothetical protein
MMKNKDVYTRAIESLKKTQDALLNEISIADGRSRIHAPTFFYVSESIKNIEELRAKNIPKVETTKEEVKEAEVKPAVKKTTAKK